jgi:hypothetical protein
MPFVNALRYDSCMTPVRLGKWKPCLQMPPVYSSAIFTREFLIEMGEERCALTRALSDGFMNPIAQWT